MTIDNVTLHASQRFAERAMGLPKEIRLTREQGGSIAERIIVMLAEKHPNHEAMPRGSFTIKDQGIIIIKEDDKVVTVKTYNKEAAPAFRGGARAQIKNKRKDTARKLGSPYKPKEF